MSPGQPSPHPAQEAVANGDAAYVPCPASVPELASLHPLGADLPQECSEINAHVFRSLRFDATRHVPAYRSWLDRTGHTEAHLLLDPDIIGRHVAHGWHDGASRMVSFARQAASGPGWVLHLQCAWLTRHPADVVSPVYRRSGLERTGDAVALVSAAVAPRPRRLRHNVYSFGDHGLDPTAERDRFRAYTDFFDVELGT